ncbi:ankyrin repeat-containing domain protein [Xylaria curta]|nr:ankyrin repeat-containing domain protein [Xylaria curta]
MEKRGLYGAQGPTTLASMIVDWLERRNVAVIYIYCNYKEEQTQTLPNMIGSLLKQLSQHRGTLSNDIRSIYDTHRQRQTQPMADELTQLLVKEVTNFSSLFIVIDALDECSERDNTRTRLLVEIQKLPQHVRILITSRYPPQFEQTSEDIPQIDINATDDDIGNYVKARIEQGHWKARNARSNTKLMQEVTKIVKKNSKGMFLLAQLHMVNLMGCLTVREIRQALETLPTGLSETYNQAMQRIRNQDQGQVELAYKVLYWISYAFRLLTVAELQHALAVQLGDEDFDEDGLHDLELMISVCAGLVTVDGESNHIRLVHYTTQNYFERTRKDWFPEALSTISKICLTYLKFRPFTATYNHYWVETPVCFDQYPFLRYAAKYWGHHVHDGMDDAVRKLTLEYLRNKDNIWNIRIITDWENHEDDHEYETDWFDFNRLHVIAPFDLADIAGDCQAEYVEVNARLWTGETPLYLAAEAGQAQMVRFLLQAGAEDKEEPLQVAVEKGHATVAQLLIEAGADVNADYDAPLFLAASSGHLNVVQILIKAGANISACNFEEGTALHGALRAGHTELAKFLIASGLDISAIDDREKTALHYAAKRGQEDVVQLLLKNGACVLAKDGSGETAIHKAVQYGHEDLVKILLESIDSGTEAERWRLTLRLSRAVAREDEKEVGLLLKMGADPNLKLYSDLSFLEHAVLRGNTKIIELLLSNGARIEDTGEWGETSLHWAAYRGFDTSVQLLLDHGADIQATDNQGTTPLHLAVIYGELAVANKLLDGGARLDAKACHGNTVLAWALHSGIDMLYREHVSNLVAKYDFPHRDQDRDIEKRLGVLDFLIKKGADLNGQQWLRHTALSLAITESPETVRVALVRRLLEKKVSVAALDAEGNSALWQAARESPGVVRLLLEHGAEVDQPNMKGVTALSRAVLHGNKENVLLLIEAGANVEAVDGDGFTILHEAVTSLFGSTDIVDLLLSHGANINAHYGDKKATVLHYADEPMFSHLLQRGAATTEVDVEGRTALEWPRAKGKR